jgi:hypothetical protein
MARPRAHEPAGFALPASALALALAACGGESVGTSSVAGAPVPADAPCATEPGITTLLSDYAYAIALHGGDAYLATRKGILRTPAAGGVPTLLTPDAEVDALAVDAANAYYISSHDVGAPNAEGKVGSATALYSAPLAGGPPQILVDDAFALEVATDGAWVWWTGVGLEGLKVGSSSAPTRFPLAPADTVEAVAVGSDSLFLAVFTAATQGLGAGSIRRAEKDGSGVTTIVSGLVHPTAIALDEDSVYFNEEGSATGGIWRAGLDGSGKTRLAQVLTASLAVDAHAVYFATSDAIQKVPKTGGAVQTVAGGLKSPGTVVVGGGNVYWVDGTSVALSDPDPGYAVLTTCK